MRNKQLAIGVIISTICTALLIHSFLYNTSLTATSFGASGTNIDGDIKQQVNFHGKLITHQGQEDAIDNISFGGKIKDIIMYDAPAQHAESELNPKTKQAEIKLDKNPTTDFVKSKIDLSKTDKFDVPNPNIIWYYQQDEKHQRIEFIQIFVTPQESSQSKPYLLEHKTHILCNSLENGGSQKKEVPLTAVKKLIIEGYSYNNPNNKKDEKNMSCPITEKKPS